MPRLYPLPLPNSRDNRGRQQFSYVDPTRSGVQFWDAIRIRIDLVIGPDSPQLRGRNRRVVRAIFDTGSPLTLFPVQVWSTFTNLIEFIDCPPGVSPRLLSVGGIKCKFRLGWIWLGVQDDERPVGRLPAQRVLAQFADDGGRLRRNVLVGLSHSVLTGRRLIRETTLEVDEPDPAILSQRRLTFGQVWRLNAV